MSIAVAKHCPSSSLPQSGSLFKQEIDFIVAIAERENSLTTARFGWFLTAQSALLAALGLVLSAALSGSQFLNKADLVLLIGLISLLGYCMSVSTIYAVSSANTVLHRMALCWDCLVKSGAREAGYCVDLFPVRHDGFSIFHPHLFIPWVTLFLWPVVAVFYAIRLFG